MVGVWMVVCGCCVAAGTGSAGRVGGGAPLATRINHGCSTVRRRAHQAIQIGVLDSATCGVRQQIAVTAAGASTR